MRKVILIAICALITGAAAQVTKVTPAKAAVTTPAAAVVPVKSALVKKDSTITSDTTKVVVCDTIFIVKHKKTAVMTTETLDTLKKK